LTYREDREAAENHGFSAAFAVLRASAADLMGSAQPFGRLRYPITVQDESQKPEARAQREASGANGRISAPPADGRPEPGDRDRLANLDNS
jgi:hypothetical protein